MPRLTRKDAELVIGLLRRHLQDRGGSQTEESRALSRLEQRVEKSLAALDDWKRRGATQAGLRKVSGSKPSYRGR
jgi:hypothetical protein